MRIKMTSEKKRITVGVTKDTIKKVVWFFPNIDIQHIIKYFFSIELRDTKDR